MADSTKSTSKVEDDARVSSDVKFSTYKENKDLPDTNPPPGRHVIQEPGVVSER